MFATGTNKIEAGGGLGGNNICPRVGKRAVWGTCENAVAQQHINAKNLPTPDVKAGGGDKAPLCTTDGEARRSTLTPPIVERHMVTQLSEGRVEAIPLSASDQLEEEITSLLRLGDSWLSEAENHAQQDTLHGSRGA